jgi:hypothetical protein
MLARISYETKFRKRLGARCHRTARASGRCWLEQVVSSSNTYKKEVWTEFVEANKLAVLLDEYGSQIVEGIACSRWEAFDFELSDSPTSYGGSEAYLFSEGHVL